MSVSVRKAPRRRSGASRATGRSGWRPLAKVGVVLAAAVAVLAIIFFAGRGGGGSAGQYPFQVGQPGVGQAAPEIKLPSTDGTTFDLASLKGQAVLLYFQEGVGCQPCWDQIKDIEAHRDQLTSLGVDKIVSITTQPLDVLKQKAQQEGISTPVLSDPNLDASHAYNANLYGMMGTSMDGHSFILVGKDGVIKWRADYGGAPKYTMYVPVSNLAADMRAGLKGAGV